MKYLLAVICALAIAWSGMWFWQAHALRDSLEAWFSERQQSGWEASYAAMDIKGFPNRLDVRFDALVLADPNARVTWEAPHFELLSLTYKPGHWILSFPAEQLLTTPTGEVRISSDGMRASLVSDAKGRVLRASVEAATLNVTRATKSTALADASFGAALLDGTQYQVAMTAAAVARNAEDLVGLTPDRLDGLRVNTHVDFDAPWTLSTSTAQRPQPTGLDIKLAEYQDRGLHLKMAGALKLDSKGRATGEVTIKTDNWREALASAPVPSGMREAMEQGLGLVAGLRGNQKSIDLPFIFERGKLRLGIIGLGTFPALRIP